MELLIILVLAIILVVLIMYNLSLSKKIKKFNSINETIKGLNIVQDFMDAIGESTTVDEKINKINEILLERYGIKYSTIVEFDGAEYVIKATNVDERHWDTLKNLHKEEIFKDSITTAQTKYISINKEDEKLPYQKMEFGRAKSAMFFPLYIDNVYIGYWIIESGIMHAFDKMDTAILEVVKENIVAVLKNVSYQNTMENIHRKDKFTGLYSAEYLYGRGKKIIDQYTISAICMFKIANIEEINEKLGRKAGNEIITRISDIVKKNISSEYLFTRYMGPKFVIVFSGIDTDSVISFVQNIKLTIERLEIERVESKAKDKRVTMKPKVNFVISNYYKGTGLEGVNKKLEEYLDNSDINENEINCI